MKEQAYKKKFIAQVVKLVSPTKSLTRRTIFKIHNKFVKFQSVFSNCYIYRYSKSKPKRKEGAVADAGGELLMEVEWTQWRDAPAKGVSIVGQRFIYFHQ